MEVAEILGGGESTQGLIWTNSGVMPSRIAQPLKARTKLELP